MTAYYNENDKFAAAWLRELIKANLIAPGEVDERSIEEVKPNDLKGFTQCHFFAGIGVWSYALRNAGWSDDSPVWTGSCPCQSFSASGQRGGFSDKRHLWPAWFRLIRECRPVTIFGEQVASKDGLAWLDVVSADLENEGYAIGSVDTCAAGVGAPHIRQRLYVCAHPASLRRKQRREGSGPTSDLNGDPEIIGLRGRQNDGYSGRRKCALGQASEISDLRNAEGNRIQIEPETAEREIRISDADESGETHDGIDAEQSRLEGLTGNVREWRGSGWLDPITARSVAEAGATRGFWNDCDWWYGRDGKYRPIGAGLFPLVTGATGRMGKLRGYGNAINAPQAQAFIEAYMETVDATSS